MAGHVQGVLLMKLFEILVPTVMLNDHGQVRPIRVRFHRVWDKKVRAISGGLTIFPPAKGQWVAPDGDLFVERMIPVRVACSPEEMSKIADMTAAYYKQEAVMYYTISNEVTIKHYGGKA